MSLEFVWFYMSYMIETGGYQALRVYFKREIPQ
jgi:hypothetical protein